MTPIPPEPMRPSTPPVLPDLECLAAELSIVHDMYAEVLFKARSQTNALPTGSIERKVAETVVRRLVADAL